MHHICFSRFISIAVFLTISLCILGCGDSGTNPSSANTPTELEGTWVGYSLNNPYDSISMLIQGNSLTYSLNGVVQYKATGALNETVSPKQMDYTVTWGPQNCPYIGKTSAGIYKLNAAKDTLMTAGGEPGVGARPTSFATGKGWPVFLLKKQLNTPDGSITEKDSIPQSGLVAYYPFNGNANDASGNENNGTVSGTILTKDRFGTDEAAYSFNGINDFIVIGKPVPQGLQCTTAITISAWILPTSIPTGNPHDDNLEAIIACQDDSSFSGYSLMMNGVRPSESGVPGGIQIQMMNGTEYYSTVGKDGVTNIAVKLNIWNHVVATWEKAENAKVYLDGILVSTFHAWQGPIKFNLRNMLCIGKHYGPGSWFGNERFFNGSIDDIRIYNRMLSASEINNLYHEKGWKK